MFLRVLYNLYIETSLTFDLTSGPLEERTEEDPSPGWTGVIDVMGTVSVA